jgi:hypothetical protein
MTAPGVGAPRLRIGTGLGSLACGSVLVADVGLSSGDISRLFWLLGVVGVLFQVLALTRWPSMIVAAGALFGTLGALALFPAENRNAAVELAVLFLATVELADWSIQLDSVITESRESVLRRLGEIGLIVAGGGLVSASMLGAAEVQGPRGRVALLIGVAAAVIPVALLAARRWRAG